jgi:hypothetical protein
VVNSSAVFPTNVHKIMYSYTTTIEVVFCFEFVVRFGAVGAYAKHDCASTGEAFHVVAEVAGFGGAAACVVFGIEVQHDIFTKKTTEGDSRCAVGGCGEIRGFGADGKCHSRKVKVINKAWLLASGRIGDDEIVCKSRNHNESGFK